MSRLIVVVVITLLVGINGWTVHVTDAFSFMSDGGYFIGSNTIYGVRAPIPRYYHRDDDGTTSTKKRSNYIIHKNSSYNNYENKNRRIPGRTSFSTPTRRRIQPSTRLFMSSSSSSDDSQRTTDEDNEIDFTPVEVSEMRELILSLSLESTDHDRRIRVRDIFHEQFDTTDGIDDNDKNVHDSADSKTKNWTRFCKLFDRVLTQVGDEIQMEARKRMFENDTNGSSSSTTPPPPVQEANSNGSNNNASETTESSPMKSPEELQLWALVDMMVQSKTIVKKHNGELGSRGAFR